MNNNIRQYLLCILLLCLPLTCVCHADDFEGDEEEEYELNEVRKEVAEILSSEEGKELELFATQKLSPAIWQEVERRSRDEPFGAMDALEFLADVYGEYQDMSEYYPAHVPAFLEMTKREIKTHMIGDRVIYLIEEEEGSDAEITSLKKQLRVELESLFDLKLQMQKRELEILEKEVEDLREILIRRSKQRKSIIEKRFNELTGAEDPIEW